MDRKTFAQKLALLGVCPLVIQNLSAEEIPAGKPAPDEELQVLQYKKQFIENWLSDLMDSIDRNLDRETQEKLIAHCGVQCFIRHQFKKDIAAAGAGDLEKLIESYKKNFEIWRDAGTIHIRYGEISQRCYCAAANYRPSKPNDIHCECTRNTHKTIFETALGRPFKVDVVESLRRGGKTCHFIVHLT